MSAEYFLDTNVIVYLFDETDADKRRQSGTLVKERMSQREPRTRYRLH